MSMQWWRTKGAPPGAAAPAAEGGAQPPQPAAALAPTAPAGLSTVAMGDIGGYASTVPGGAPPSHLSDAAPLFLTGGPSGFAPNLRDTALNALPPPQPEGFRHDPEFEDAAIFFANGDFRSAEASLLAVCDQRQGDGQAEAWLVLFDLYRAAGWQESFENAALDYAARFDRSAPLWFSLPDLLGEAPEPGASAPPAGFGWVAPPLLTGQAAAALDAAPTAGGPVQLNWEALAAIDPAALAPLVRVFVRWLDTPGLDLRFQGAARLESLLRDRTLSHDRSVDAGWWRLRLELLRLLAQPEAFDLAALDYCITYEVSPPPWQPPRCRFQQSDHLALDGVSTLPADFVPSGTGDIDLLGAPAAQTGPAGPVPALSGHLVGDAGAALAPVDAALAPHGGWRVDCGRLARVDFTAAGTILNWAAAHEAEGRRLQFAQVQRLVAVFFNVIGINEHALIQVRKD
ncbi:STAS domain-containing protein [Xylophilus sp.]|uniref:STAS domain-containing protein n=1 Tax=Xylophilus sp. TaxID=2653893 RepID=UPI0013BD03E6|nr:STAS domain-containing protein [Xylophilus sp.]KAF1048966.1 MAG: hypothetical protein GAK38_01081 [Xylophilus sp.]